MSEGLKISLLFPTGTLRGKHRLWKKEGKAPFQGSLMGGPKVEEHTQASTTPHYFICM